MTSTSKSYLSGLNVPLKPGDDNIGEDNDNDSDNNDDNNDNNDDNDDDDDGNDDDSADGGDDDDDGGGGSGDNGDNNNDDNDNDNDNDNGKSDDDDDEHGDIEDQGLADCYDVGNPKLHEWFASLRHDPLRHARRIICLLRSTGGNRDDFHKFIEDGNTNRWFSMKDNNGKHIIQEVPNLQLLQDVKTRWDSVYLMLERLRVLCPVSPSPYPDNAINWVFRIGYRYVFRDQIA
jgi:hypothetical protein